MTEQQPAAGRISDPPAAAAGNTRRIQRALAITVVALLLTAILAAVGTLHVLSITRAVLSLHAQHLHHAEQLRTELQRAVAADRAYLLTADARHREEMQQAHRRFRQIAETLTATTVTAVGRRMLAQISEQNEQRSQAVQRLAETAMGPDSLRTFEEEIIPLSRALDDLIARYIERKRALLADAEAELDRDTSLIGLLLLAITAAGIALAFGVWRIVRAALARIVSSEQHLQATIRSRDEFLASVGHELRSPLAVLKLNAKLLELRAAKVATAVPTADMADSVQAIERNVDTLAALIDRLIDLSLAAHGRLQLERATVDLAQLAHDAVARLGSLRPDCPLSVAAAGPVLGHWDPARIRQVIDNLVGNAIRHACDGPITVSVEARGSSARLRVEDRGKGIPPADRERIFVQFERLAPSTDGSGMGLGLSIVRAIVHAHGGSIRVDDAPAGGTVFIVDLPTQRA